MFIVAQDGSLLNMDLIQKIYIQSGNPLTKYDVILIDPLCKLMAEYEHEEDVILEGTEDTCEVARRKLIEKLEVIRLDSIAPDLGISRN